MGPPDMAYLVIFFVMIYSSVLWFLVFFANRRSLAPAPLVYFPSITFLIPAYNAEKTIGRCIESVLSLDYPKKPEVVVINDGSTDRTREIAESYGERGVTVISKKNEGRKSKALNCALRTMDIQTEAVACMDADSYAEKDYLKRIAPLLEHAEAVTPAMKVAEPVTLMQKVQWVEYCFSIFLRRLFSIFDCQYVLPGPGSVYKTEALKRAGFFDEDNLTEDMELAFRMYDLGFRIDNRMDAYVHTECPATFRELLRQRIRWYRGYMQNVGKYRYMVLNPAYGNLGFFLLPINFVWIFILLFLFFYPAFNIWKAAVDVLYRWAAINFALTMPKLNIGVFYLDFFISFWLLFFVMNAMTIYLSIKTSGERLELGKRKKNYLAFALLYPALLAIFWIASLLYELAGKRERW